MNIGDPTPGCYIDLMWMAAWTLIALAFCVSRRRRRTGRAFPAGKEE